MGTIPLVHTGPHYPSHFKIWNDCRRRYKLKVIEKRRGDEPFSRALEKGRATHAVLKLCIDRLLDTPPTCPADLHGLVAAHLPLEPYPSDEAWRADVEEIVDWVKYAITYVPVQR